MRVKQQLQLPNLVEPTEAAMAAPPKRRRMRVEQQLQLPSELASLVDSTEAAVGWRLEEASLGTSNLREVARQAALLLHTRYLPYLHVKSRFT
jgi:hypothetical protein